MNPVVLLRAVPAATRNSRSLTASNRTKNIRYARAGAPIASSCASLNRNYASESHSTNEETKSTPKEQQVAKTTQDTGSDVAVETQGRGGDRSVGFVDPFDNFLPTEFKQLRNQMNNMMRSMDSVFGLGSRGFLDPFQSPSLWTPPAAISDFVPKIDVSETDKSIHVHAELPGMSKDGIKISVDNGVLEISGEKNFEKRTEDKKRKYHRVERSYGSFSRRFAVPRGTKASDVKAKFQNGVLEVEVPKSEESKGHSEVKIE